ncbi:MAG: hypothetical protein WC054_00260 [Candidatus Nanopelagicales bacterium]
MPMMWIAYDPMVFDRLKNREQFNGVEPAWGESLEDFKLKQGIDVPQVGDVLVLRMGVRTVYDRRLEAPDTDDDGVPVSSWYWTVLVK